MVFRGKESLFNTFALLRVSLMFFARKSSVVFGFFLLIICHIQRNAFPFCAQDDDSFLFPKRKV